MLKSANSFLESKVKSLEKKMHDAQTQLVNLELISLHTSCKCVESNKMKNNKNYKGLESKIKYPLKEEQC